MFLGCTCTICCILFIRSITLTSSNQNLGCALYLIIYHTQVTVKAHGPLDNCKFFFLTIVNVTFKRFAVVCECWLGTYLSCIIVLSFPNSNVDKPICHQNKLKQEKELVLSFRNSNVDEPIMSSKQVETRKWIVKTNFVMKLKSCSEM